MKPKPLEYIATAAGLLLLILVIVALCVCGCAKPSPVPTSLMPPKPKALVRRNAEAVPVPARTNITLAWTYNPDIVATFNLYHSTDFKSWSIWTNTADHSVTVPFERSHDLFAITATNQNGESARYFISP